MRRAGHLPDGVVHVRAERLAALVAVEQRRKHSGRKRRRDEQRVLLERRKDHLAQFARGGRSFRQLHVVFGARRLMAGGDAAIHPFGLIQKLAGAQNLIGSQYIGDGQKHYLRSEFEFQPDQRRAARSQHDVRRDAVRRSNSGWQCC